MVFLILTTLDKNDVLEMIKDAVLNSHEWLEILHDYKKPRVGPGLKVISMQSNTKARERRRSILELCHLQLGQK